MKGVMRFGKKGKLSPRFISLFEILERVDKVAHRLALTPSLSSVHLVFHISMLWRYIMDNSQVISMDSIELGPNLTYEEEPTAIVDRQVQKLWTKEIALIKVYGQHGPEREATWEFESDMWTHYLYHFEASGVVLTFCSTMIMIFNGG